MDQALSEDSVRRTNTPDRRWGVEGFSLLSMSGGAAPPVPIVIGSARDWQKQALQTSAGPRRPPHDLAAVDGIHRRRAFHRVGRSGNDVFPAWCPRAAFARHAGNIALWIRNPVPNHAAIDVTTIDVATHRRRIAAESVAATRRFTAASQFPGIRRRWNTACGSTRLCVRSRCRRGQYRGGASRHTGATSCPTSEQAIP